MEYIKAKTILRRGRNKDMWFSVQYNMNLYRGCSHGCIYCDSICKCYGIANFDNVPIKADALEILNRELEKKIKKALWE